MLVVIPFSVLFGAVAREAGMDILQIMAMSAVVFAGSAQFTALALLQDGAPVFIAILAGLAVNLRMALYSVALIPHLGHAPFWKRGVMSYLMVDQAFAVAVKTYDSEPDMPRAAKIPYYFGVVASVCPLWLAFTWVGAVVGRTIPPDWQLDFALPICFIALTAPLLRSLAHVVACFVAVSVALMFAWVPWNLWLILAALAGMAAGAEVERRAARV
ncbi:branched-chain amino acid transporter AzlC [Pseudaestuariivita atlantica]|uniref:Branched-chain amino acid transporter AzlC n=2 Tax=Pseudaestuariivita atlantica TaxID=1317121 RepID=A0A0L1JTH7_9RHOB|nr:branched-chain amino acid transporter AzlC [Pseudaestuariivita atlantica]